MFGPKMRNIFDSPKSSSNGVFRKSKLKRSFRSTGTLPVSRGNLAAWIVDPHGIKPGVNMPMIKLAPDDLNAISAYLEGLK